MQKTFKNHQKSIQNALQNRSRRAPEPSCEPVGRLEPPKTAQDAGKRRQESARSAPRATPKRFSAEKGLQNKTWLSWNGKRVRRESVEHCRRSKRRKSSGEEEEQEHEHQEEQQRKTSKSITSHKPARLDIRGWALARALRARARPVGVGIISWFSKLSLETYPLDHSKTCANRFQKLNPQRLENRPPEGPKLAKHSKQAYRKHVTGTVQNEAPGGRKYKQKCFNIHQQWLPNGSPEASGRPLGAEPASRAFFAPFWRGLGAARGGSWGLLGSLLAPLGVVLGLPRCPRRLPEGPREGPGEPLGRHFGSIFAAGPCGTKKIRKISSFYT